MAASSSTGTGIGSADGKNKGPGNNRNLYTPINGPHIIAAGTTELISGEGYYAIITFPQPLEGGYLKYVTKVTSIGIDNDDWAQFEPTNDEDGNYEGFTIVAQSDSPASWVVIKPGFSV